MKRLVYEHGCETHVVGAIEQGDDNKFKTLVIDRNRINVPNECLLQVGDTLDVYSTRSFQEALIRKIPSVLIHSNPLGTCKTCPIKGKCEALAPNALEFIGKIEVFKTEIEI